ncbi:hypothetical protein [Stutzerimonas xanthomarina]|uniref:hypothetical protein n=1 Tax=Stutzerimonas xanthomarina TaxID=271420 RepID=UPI003AA978B6
MSSSGRERAWRRSKRLQGAADRHHRPDPGAQPAGHRTQLGLLRELKQEGRVRYIGVTHYLESAHDRLLETLKQEKVDFVQFNYSVGERTPRSSCCRTAPTTASPR